MLLVSGVVRAEPSVLGAVMAAAQAVVNVKAESAAVFGDEPQGFLDPASGQVVVMRKVAPVAFTRTGAGVVIDASGLIATNAHTVNQAGRITVTFEDGESSQATLVHEVLEDDVAILRIDSRQPLRALSFSDSDVLPLGSPVYSVGHSPLLKNTVSEGVVSGLGTRQEGPATRTRLIRATFEVYQGDSGSPFLDKEGRLVGLAAAGETSGNRETYAIPANVIKQHYLAYLKKALEEGT